MSSGSPSAPLAVVPLRFGPADVGRRVSARFRLPGEGAGASDVVGVLRRWDVPAGVLEIERRDGSTGRFAAQHLLGGLVVAPAWGAYDLQQVAQGGWPPREREALSDWELRWHDGVTGRANSARVGPETDVDLAAILGRVTGWYGARGATALLQTPSPSAFDPELDAAGWVVVRRTALFTATTAEVLARCHRRATPGGGLLVRSAAGPDPAWTALLDEPLDIREPLLDILTAPAEVVFTTAVDAATGDELGIGRASISTGRGRRAGPRWSGVTSVATAPAARRRGVATGVLAALAQWSAQREAPLMYLQVLASNAAAIAVYERLGFTRHHDYVYRTAPGGPT